MDIHITYETLFDLLRKERSLDDLQELDQWFWKYVVDYLNEREAFLETTSQLQQEKTRIELFNIKRIVKEIYERRERKIVQLAMNVIKTSDHGFVDTRSMLAEEKKLFDETISLLLTYKRGILDQVCTNKVPIITPEIYEKKDLIPKSDEHPIDYSTKEEIKTSVPGEQFIKSNPEEEASKLESLNQDKSNNIILVKFKMSVPKFLGKNKEVFGPFEAGTVTSLPENIASILIKKEKVEKVMAI